MRYPHWWKTPFFIWLVVWLPFYILGYIGFLIIPNDVHIFQRGWNQPPTSYGLSTKNKITLLRFASQDAGGYTCEARPGSGGGSRTEAKGIARWMVKKGTIQLQLDDGWGVPLFLETTTSIGYVVVMLCYSCYVRYHCVWYKTIKQ